MEKVTAEQVLDELVRRYRDELRELPALGTEEAAKALDVSVATVKRWCDQGKLECWRSVGGHRRVTAQSVADYLNAHSMELHPDPNASVPYRLVSAVTGVSITPDGKLSAVVGQAMPAAAVSEDDMVELNQ